MPICPYCGGKVVPEDPNVIKNDIKGLNTRCYYHVNCHMVAQVTPKNQWPYNVKKLEEEENEISVWAEIIYDYYLRDLKFSPDMKKIKSQMKTFMKKEMRPEGMYKTIRFFYEIENKGKILKDETGGGIGIVPYVYEKARDYWQKTVANQYSKAAKIDKQIEAFKNRKDITIKKHVQKQDKSKYIINLDEI